MMARSSAAPNDRVAWETRPLPATRSGPAPISLPAHHEFGTSLRLVVAVACGLLYLVAGVYLTLGLHVIIGDNLSRMANGYYTVFSRDPHLAAVGFVWNPLPSFFALPFLILLKPFGLMVISGSIVSALFAALNVVLVWRIVNQIGVRRWTALILVAIYALNPFTILYAANGMTESTFLAQILILTTAMISWQQSGTPGPLLWAGMACGIAAGVRYETLALVGAGCGVIVVVWWQKYRGDYERLEGEVLAFVLPYVFVMGLWMFANWLIMGSPLYFQSGPESNTAQTERLRHSAVGAYSEHLYHHVGPVLSYALERCLYFMPVLLPLVALAVLVYTMRRRTLALVPLAFPSIIVVFHIGLLYSGGSFGWLRFFSYSLPLGIFAAAMVLGQIAEIRRPRLRSIRLPASAAVLLAVALSLPSTLHAMQLPLVGREEHPVFDLMAGRKAAAGEYQWVPERQMASYVDSLRLPQGSVITDTQAGFAPIMFSHNPRQFVIPSDYDFDADLQQLTQFHGYVMVFIGQSTGVPVILQRYPGLAHNQVTWARLQRHIGPLWLYKLLPAG